MITSRLATLSLRGVAIAALIACRDGATSSAPREVASVEVTLPQDIEVNQPATAIAVARDRFGAVIDGEQAVWSSSFPPVAGIQASTGEIFALAGGNTEITATVAGVIGHQRLTVSPPPIIINEVFPNGDLPGGFVELFNPTPHAVDLSGWTISSNDLSAWFTFPAGAIIESGGYVAVNEVTLPRPLNAFDAVYLFSKFGAVSDQYRWSANLPGTAYARCPDGIGVLTLVTTPTRKAPNAC